MHVLSSHSDDRCTSRLSKQVRSWRLDERVVHASLENASTRWLQTEPTPVCRSIGGKPSLLTCTSWPSCWYVVSSLCVLHAALALHPFHNSTLPFRSFLAAHSNTPVLEKFGRWCVQFCSWLFFPRWAPSIPLDLVHFIVLWALHISSNQECISHRPGRYCSLSICFKSEARLPRQPFENSMHLFLILLASVKETIVSWLTGEPWIKCLTKCLNSPFGTTRWNERANFCKRLKGGTFLTPHDVKKAPKVHSDAS